MMPKWNIFGTAAVIIGLDVGWFMEELHHSGCKPTKSLPAIFVFESGDRGERGHERFSHGVVSSLKKWSSFFFFFHRASVFLFYFLSLPLQLFFEG